MADQFTPGIIDEVEKQSYVSVFRIRIPNSADVLQMFQDVAKEIRQHGGTRITIGFWPFTTTMFDNATNSAFPHDKGKPNCPIIVYFTWEGKQNDAYWIDTMKTTLDNLRAKVLEERPESKGLPYFINTALAEATTVEDLYRNNLPELKELRKKYDPNGVMDRTGGFRILAA